MVSCSLSDVDRSRWILENTRRLLAHDDRSLGLDQALVADLTAREVVHPQQQAHPDQKVLADDASGRQAFLVIL